MTVTKVDQATIQRLNDLARAICDTEGEDPQIALNRVVQEQELRLVVSDDGQCEVYVMSDGRYVNLWIEAPGSDIDSGGLGFDDQIEWAEVG